MRMENRADHSIRRRCSTGPSPADPLTLSGCRSLNNFKRCALAMPRGRAGKQRADGLNSLTVSANDAADIRLTHLEAEQSHVAIRNLGNEDLVWKLDEVADNKLEKLFHALSLAALRHLSPARTRTHPSRWKERQVAACMPENRKPGDCLARFVERLGSQAPARCDRIKPGVQRERNSRDRIQRTSPGGGDGDSVSVDIWMIRRPCRGWFYADDESPEFRSRSTPGFIPIAPPALNLWTHARCQAGSLRYLDRKVALKFSVSSPTAPISFPSERSNQNQSYDPPPMK